MDTWTDTIYIFTRKHIFKFRVKIKSFAVHLSKHKKVLSFHLVIVTKWRTDTDRL